MKKLLLLCLSVLAASCDTATRQFESRLDEIVSGHKAFVGVAIRTPDGKTVCLLYTSFSPTDSGSAEELLKTASTAITSVNGVYRSMWTAGWSTTGNTHQCFGIAAYNLALDVMADDLIMQSQGNGWFWHDHTYNMKSNYTSSIFRSYDVWYANYRWISNVNYIIDAAPAMEGSQADVAYVVGQALSLIHI